ncbi:MAG: response regulator transcription factor [Bacteroidota bacterium]
MIQIGIIDDEQLFRIGLRHIIEDIENVEVAIEAENGQVLLEQLKERQQQGQSLPDLLLLDLQMPVLNGVETAKRLQKKYPNIKIIILSTHLSREFILNMIELGASSYLGKNTDPEEIETTILKVASKGFHYNDRVMQIITENMRSKSKPKIAFSTHLTSRELEILQLICEQYTGQEIADRLFISRRTVEAHRNNLLQKLNCKNIAGLVVYAIQNDLVKIDPTQFWT